jgi:hypothetical protein
MKLLYKILSALSLVLLLQLSAEAQVVTAVLDSNNILVGEQTTIRLTVSYRADNGKHIKIEWPQIADTLRKEVELISSSGIDTVVDKNDPLKITQSRILYITSFDSGYWAIPPFEFAVSGDTGKLFSDALLLQVSPVAVDTTLAIKDIKPPYSEEYSWLDWLKDHKKEVLIGLAGLIVLSILLYFLIKHSKKPKPVVVPEAPKIPPHVIANEKFERLKEQKLWQEGKLKQYHSELTDILREYIEGRFRIAAQEQTTEEIIFAFRNLAVDEESKAKLKQTLLLADLVKFAKEHPLPAENELSLQHAIEFVAGTMREESTDPKKNPGV